MRPDLEPPVINEDCKRCYGALWYPTPWVGHHAHHVACSCPAGQERNRRLRGPYLDKSDLWGGNDHRLELLLAEGRAAWVDSGIAMDVLRLWEAGIWTWVSCQGDLPNQPRYIGITDPSRADEAANLLGWVDRIKHDGEMLYGVFDWEKV